MSVRRLKNIMRFNYRNNNDVFKYTPKRNLKYFKCSHRVLQSATSRNKIEPDDNKSHCDYVEVSTINKKNSNSNS